MKIVLTGFEPFWNNPTNPSGDVALALGGTNLPVTYRAVDSFLQGNEGDFYLCLGLHRQADRPRLEARAHNRASKVIPDSSGTKFKDDQIGPGEAELGTAVDIPELFASLTNQGFPCSVSDNPGTYLCNYLYYNALSKSEGKALFIHLPPVSEEWPLERMKRFVDAVRRWLIENAE